MAEHRPPDVAQQRFLEARTRYDGIDSSYLDLNLLPRQTAADNFPLPKEAVQITNQRQLPKIGPLFDGGLDAAFLRKNKPPSVVTVKNVGRLPAWLSAKIQLRQNSDVLYAAPDAEFFAINGHVRGDKQELFAAMPEAAWRYSMRSGIMQATRQARKRYGLAPKRSYEPYPPDPPDLSRRIPLLPNVHVLIAEPEETGTITKRFEKAGLKHNFIADSGQSWVSAFDQDQMYLLLYLRTSLRDSDQQQRNFLTGMLGDILTPERDEKMRAKGGYSNSLSYLLGHLAYEAMSTSMPDYQYTHATRLSQAGAHAHSLNGANMYNAGAANLINMVGSDMYSGLCNSLA